MNKVDKQKLGSRKMYALATNGKYCSFYPPEKVDSNFISVCQEKIIKEGFSLLEILTPSTFL